MGSIRMLYETNSPNKQWDKQNHDIKKIFDRMNKLGQSKVSLAVENNIFITHGAKFIFLHILWFNSVQNL